MSTLTEKAARALWEQHHNFMHGEKALSEIIRETCSKCNYHILKRLDDPDEEKFILIESESTKKEFKICLQHKVQLNYFFNVHLLRIFFKKIDMTTRDPNLWEY